MSNIAAQQNQDILSARIAFAKSFMGSSKLTEESGIDKLEAKLTKVAKVVELNAALELGF